MISKYKKALAHLKKVGMRFRVSILKSIIGGVKMSNIFEAKV